MDLVIKYEVFYLQPGSSNQLAENKKWAWHFNLFSMARFNFFTAIGDTDKLLQTT